ncbi:U3 small nucleolar ribonucleoprotein protein MPP10 [Engystomops pustulosus]|uniref:U3 small nucleolar ribonucleoprotein protein MPP10 n=1 Tax=Engystomops pustulosus TaxID=76066 RepID=UPI003AFA76B3
MAELLRPRLWQCMGVLEAVETHPEQMLSVQEELATDFSKLTKALYDLHKTDEAIAAGSPLKELVIENFDEEQIWQQLELQNEKIIHHFNILVNRAVKDEDIYFFQQSDEDDEDDENEDDDELSENDQEEEAEKDPTKNGKIPKGDRRNSQVSLVKNKKAAEVEKYSDDDSDMDFDIDKLEQEQKKNTVKQMPKEPTKKSVVDDQFFKLSEMESFLEAVEKEDDKKNDDEEEVDYFEEIDSFDEDEDDEQSILDIRKAAKSSRNLEYNDFFDPVEDDEGIKRQPISQGDDEGEEMEEGADEEDDIAENDDDIGEDEDYSDAEDDENVMQDTEESKKAKEAFKRVTFDLSDGSEGEDVHDILGGNKKSEQEPNEIKSSLEKREAKMTEKIQSLEKQMLEEKAWQMVGEVTAQKRPENSLLSESLVFDHASRTAPIITEETTLQLEDVIKQRIKDQVWDDVVRKEKPKEDAFEYKKRLTLDHEKSKLSLAEIYEQEYLKLHQKKTEEEEKPSHVEIQKLMDSLFRKLDALSNFHFTPKPAVPDIKVVSNLPAISMEEVAPVGVSEAALLAPEEIKEKNKAGDIKTSSEKTATDKKRERRKKKIAKKFKIKEREKRIKLAEQRKAEKGKKQTKKEVAASIKKLTKEGKATLLKDEGKDKALKSSQAFFSQLQDQVKLQIKGVKALQKKPKKNELSVHKLKL